MILYLDTSALVKLYIPEQGSIQVRKLLAKAEAAASSSLAYVEIRSAFARLRRESILSEKIYQKLIDQFEKDWKNYLIVEVGEEVLHRAAELVELYALRAYDGVHLSSVDYLCTSQGPPLIFSCFDQKLNQAASHLNIPLM